ncbi:MAG: Hsp33 family molecular chaperone HslO [Gammaproteobacteria bacterium]|nr:Hsp33 family molecular chaperone HslO [Gammaproteobacteria bacterium]
MSGRDVLNRFLIETADVRGLIVHLDDTWEQALARVDYPDPVREVLGQAFAASVLLAATIKFDGKMTFQVRGEGPIHLLVVQITSARKMRGLARWKSEPTETSLTGLFGDKARLTMTIEATETGAPYQGIVALEGESLAEALTGYFRNSEQLETRLQLAVDEQQAAGLLLQKLPGQVNDPDGWARASQLATTLTCDELLTLDVDSILHRLYHEEQVRLFAAESVAFECSCSRDRSDGLIQGLGATEAQSILQEQGSIEITCEFCDAQYRYDSVDVALLFASGDAVEGDQTLH